MGDWLDGAVIPVYVYTRSRKTGNLIENYGFMSSDINWHGGCFFKCANSKKYMTNISSKEGEVRGQTVWFYEPNKAKASVAFEQKDIEMAMFYASKCRRKVICDI
jgi:hypothetical protein